jgi:hypothetical protein
VIEDEFHSESERTPARKSIDPALGLDLRRERTLGSEVNTLCVGIPAHNEVATVAQAIAAARIGLKTLGVEGTVIVAASGCTDQTAAVAADAGARVLEVGLGKGVAIAALIAAFGEDALCLLDADLQYFGDEPLVATLARPVVAGFAEAVLADLHWRPVYPRLWMNGFFAPLAGALFPEALVALGSTPWTGQRAAIANIWRALVELPEGFSVDLAINMQWVLSGARVVTVPTDDWTNPQRPKPHLMRDELAVLLDAATAHARLQRPREHYERWFDRVHGHMAEYRPGADDPSQFEQRLLDTAISELYR